MPKLQWRPEASQMSRWQPGHTLPFSHLNLLYLCLHHSRKSWVICSPRQDPFPQAHTAVASSNITWPQPPMGFCKGVCVPLFNPGCHKVRQVESARNPLLSHLSKNQRSNSRLLQVCQTDALPNREHSRNTKLSTLSYLSRPDAQLLCTSLGQAQAIPTFLSPVSTKHPKILQFGSSH